MSQQTDQNQTTETALADQPTASPSRSGGCCGGKAAATDQVSPWQRLRRVDWMLWGSLTVTALAYGWYLINPASPVADHSAMTHFTHGVFDLINTMWWGLLLGVVFVGLMDRVPKELVMQALGGTRKATGILKATAAGVAFDLCSHGILMVGMKLYERGATIGQTFAFLLASPWNSISLTIILIALIGWPWTLAFIVLSAVIGVITGLVVDSLVARGLLPDNPNRMGVTPPDAPLSTGLRRWFSSLQPSGRGAVAVLADGLRGSKMVLRWLLFGVVLASLIRAFVPAEVFADWFGPGLLGLFITVIVATIIEVCSEGSAPIAADIVNRAGAPGNGFTFLMTGVATDYTEVMSLRDTTGRWVLAFAVPIIAVPQTIMIAALINHVYGL
ncbi:MAG: permease [Pseudomonadota bacterium]